MENRPMTPTAATPPVVTLPAEIDTTNSSQVEADLAAACISGVSIVVADLSSTTFADSSAVRVLVHTHKLALSMGIELRLVVTPYPVRRIFELTGLNDVLQLYPTIDAAVGHG